MHRIKILIVDDHPMMRNGLETAIAEEPDMQVIGRAGNGFEALEMAARECPDLILMDLLMPGMGGLEAIEVLQKTQPQTKILAVSSHEQGENIKKAIQAGALGYFPKSASRPYLLDAIRKVAEGIPFLPNGIF